MAVGYIRRGTTPYIVCRSELDLTGYTLHLAVEDKEGVQVVADNAQLAASSYSDEEGFAARFRLTQEQTLSLAVGPAQIQLRVIESEEAMASNILDITIEDVLEEGVIVDVY